MSTEPQLQSHQSTYYKSIYLDHNATTAMHKEVAALMCTLMQKPLNPSSIHAYGQEARSIVETARKQVAKSLKINTNDKKYQIIFTSSGTEANNTIINNFLDKKIFISKIEHLSIFSHFQRLQNKHNNNNTMFQIKQYNEGGAKCIDNTRASTEEVMFKNGTWYNGSSHGSNSTNIGLINVDKNGIVDLLHLESLLQKYRDQDQNTNNEILISVMLANNETGVIQPVQEIVEIAKKFNALVHSDCSQAFGKMELNIHDLGVNFATISAHKIGGPLGVGALVCNSAYPIKPLIIGGGQEKGFRSGTENVIAIAGFGKACEISDHTLKMRVDKMRSLQYKLEVDISQNFPNIEILSKSCNRLPNTSLLLIYGQNGHRLLIGFDLAKINVSNGSACSSGKVSASHVLDALGYGGTQEMQAAIRVSTSAEQTEEEIDTFLQVLKKLCKTQ